MEMLRSNRLEGVGSPRAAEDDNDDGLDNELSHLEEAERAMRDELAAAVMEFGLSLPTSPTAAGDASTAVDVNVYVPGEGGMNDIGSTCKDESEEKPRSRSQQFDMPDSQHNGRRDLSDSSFRADNIDSPEKVSNMGADDANVRSQADIIDERELYAALTDLCNWIREGDSLHLRLQQQEEKRQGTGTSSPYRRRHQYSPVRDGGAMRRSAASPCHRSPQRVDGTAIAARRRRPPSDNTRRRPSPNLKNLPVDELCRWLNDSSTPKSANTMRNDKRCRTSGNHVMHRGNQAETETPHTFHVPSVTGASSLLVLGSAVGTVRPPQGRSPLRKTHC